MHTLGESLNLFGGELRPFLLPLIHLLYTDNTLCQKEPTYSPND